VDVHPSQSANALHQQQVDYEETHEDSIDKAKCNGDDRQSGNLHLSIFVVVNNQVANGVI
jgi:hypothetical protein